MRQQSRRNTLKGLALTLPAAWSAPVVTSVILPAHAQSSPCGAPEGCYQVDFDGVEIERSFLWPGGAGPETVDVFNNTGCSGDPDATDTAVVAVDAEEAATALSCEFPDDPPIVPSPSAGCSFFVCDGPIND